MFCWHKWGQYGPAIQDCMDNNHQVRRCEKCGAITRRKICGYLVARLRPQQINDALKGVVNEPL